MDFARSIPTRIDHLLLPVVKALVLLPDSVEIVISANDRSIVLTLTVDASDRGRIIGKQGKMLQALRLIAQSVAAVHDLNCSVQLNEAEQSSSFGR